LADTVLDHLGIETARREAANASGSGFGAGAGPGGTAAAMEETGAGRAARGFNAGQRR